MSLASIIIVSACAFIVILSLCIATNINYILKQIESDVGVTLFLGDAPTDEEVDELKAEIEAMDHVVLVEYVSAQEALQDFAGDTGMDLSGFEDDNPLPRSLIVTLDDINSQAQFITRMEELQYTFEEKILGINPTEEESSTQATTAQAATQASTQATTQAATQAQTVAQPSTQSVTVAQANAPATATTVAQTQAATQAATQATTLAPKNEAEAPVGISPNMPEIVSQATTEAVAASGVAQLGDADYVFTGIESITHARQFTETLMTIDTVFKIVAVAIIAVLCIVAIGIIMNTIKLTVFIRKNEINIMKYVGATDWFIRWPFIIEGIVIGIIGAAIPTVLCWFGYGRLYDMYKVNQILSNIGSIREANEIFAIIAPITIGVGILLGAIGSINSIRKHLRV